MKVLSGLGYVDVAYGRSPCELDLEKESGSMPSLVSRICN